MSKFQNTIKEILPKRVIKGIQFLKRNYTDIYALKSYSQEGEDMILRRIFENKDIGFYIDVGAHHPKRFSNTYYFYKKGWKGINIDAMPKSMDLFEKMRPRDINIEAAISNQHCDLIYYEFNEPALNGFSKELSELRDNSEQYFITSSYILRTSSLNQVLSNEFGINFIEIDFLTIDVEGLDFNVIKSIDLLKFRPNLILVEILSNDLTEIFNSDIALYLKEYNYKIYAKTLNTIFFIRIDFNTEEPFS